MPFPTTDPVVPLHLLPYGCAKQIMLRATGYIKTRWGWSPTCVAIWVDDFQQVPAAFDQIINMRVVRIESMDGQFAVSKEKRP